MRQVHHAGEKCFVDYAGQKPRLIDPATGEVREVELFVAVLGASNYTYAEATRTQQRARLDRQPRNARSRSMAVSPRPSSATSSRAAWSCRAATSRGCSAPTKTSPRTTAPRSCRRGRHTRGTRRRLKSLCRSPSDGSSRACATRRFFTLAALNARIAELLTDLNARRMRLYGASRRGAVRAPRPAGAAPAARRSPSSTASGRSPASTSTTTSRSTATTTPSPTRSSTRSSTSASAPPPSSVFHRGQRVAAHARDARRGRHTTIPRTCPRPISIIWSGHPRGSSTGPHDRPADRRPRRGDPRRPAASRAGLPLVPRPLALRPRHGDGRLEAACTRAVAPARAPIATSTRSSSTASTGSRCSSLLAPLPLAPSHEHVRGPAYYQ